jgi:hypothetical protein
MFDWFKPEHRKRRKLIKLDRELLEARARRFLKSYLAADVRGKRQYYRAVDDISKKCQPPVESGLEDADVAEATSAAAMKMVMHLNDSHMKTDNFVTDACATVAIAYHRAAGVYAADAKMQELGTAAVHLLTMATSYMSVHRDQQGADQNVLPFGEQS